MFVPRVVAIAMRIEEETNITGNVQRNKNLRYFINYPLQSLEDYLLRISADFQDRDHAKCRTKSRSKSTKAFYAISMPFSRREKMALFRDSIERIVIFSPQR